MPILEVLALAAAAALTWFWLESLKVREAAVGAAREACEAEGVLLLDDTVAIASVKLARNDAGRITVQRAYDFEYSDTGNDRRRGTVVLLGRRVVLLNVGMRDPATITRLH
jgi:hypothetical protein